MTASEAITAIEKALEAGPTRGTHVVSTYEGQHCVINTDARVAVALTGWIGADDDAESRANAAFIAACSPLAIRTLLDAHASALRDAERYRWLRDEAMAVDHRSPEFYIAVDSESISRWALGGPVDPGCADSGPDACDRIIDSARAAMGAKGAAPELADLGINGSRCGTHGTSGS